jgi:hypothetical protein
MDECPGDLIKANLRWADRIARENNILSLSLTPEFQFNRSVASVQGKIGSMPSPTERQLRVLEFMKLKEEAERNEPDVTLNPLSPRKKFLIPQLSSQAFGWAESGQFTQGTKTIGVEPKGTLTGLYNKIPNVETDGSGTPRASKHTVGYVTLVGQDSHPRKGVREKGSEPIKREGGFWQSKYSESRQICKLPTALSVPTTVIREADRKVISGMFKYRQFMNRIGSNRWYHPLSSNEVSEYGDAYVKCMGTGPFSKTQLLVSR